MAIMKGYTFDKANGGLKNRSNDSRPKEDTRMFKVETIPAKQPTYTKIKLRTEKYSRCDSKISRIKDGIQQWLWGAGKLVQSANSIPGKDMDDFVDAQKTNFAGIMEASMVMADALIKEYGIEEPEDIEDLRNIILEVQDKAGDILR